MLVEGNQGMRLFHCMGSVNRHEQDHTSQQKSVAFDRSGLSAFVICQQNPEASSHIARLW